MSDASACRLETQPYRRRRPALSCIECRRRKVKCDRKDPCTPCIAVKTHCSYKTYGKDSTVRQNQQYVSSQNPVLNSTTHSGSQSAGDHQPQTNRPILTNGALLPGALDTAPIIAENQISSVTEHIQARAPINNQIVEPDLANLLQRVQKLEKSSGFRGDHGSMTTNQNLLALQSELQDSQIGETKARVLRWSQWQRVDEKVQSDIDVRRTVIL